MNRGLQIVFIGLLSAALAYAGVYLGRTAGSRQLLESPQPELAWLKQEYHLSDAEFARLSKLHAAYLPQCERRCREVAELNSRLERALGEASHVTPEIRALLLERSATLAQCQAEMLDHFYAVSQTMPPAQGRRYLAWVQRKTCLPPNLMAGREMPAAVHP